LRSGSDYFRAFRATVFLAAGFRRATTFFVAGFRRGVLFTAVFLAAGFRRVVVFFTAGFRRGAAFFFAAGFRLVAVRVAMFFKMFSDNTRPCMQLFFKMFLHFNFFCSNFH
jgi:hypothetical protein